MVYVATLAPDVTFWDAGELAAAVHGLGIPHPPGTPLFVLAARVWRELVPWLGTAAATNLFSAVCSAAAMAVLGTLLARRLRSAAAGLAAALCAGAMATVWLNATETEVYAAALLLSALMLWAGDRAGRSGEPRWLALTGYLFALAAPLHLIALVAAPAATVLAASKDDGGVDTSRAALLGGAFLVAAGAGTLRPALLALGAGVLLVAAALHLAGRSRHRALAAAPALLAACVAALTAFAYLYVRARHDPALNQGNPSNLGALLDVIGRRQYAVAPLWPRQAPVWLQFGNVLQYADWQVALGLAPGVAPSAWRTLLTVAYLLLGWLGAGAHRRADPAGWRALLALLVAGSVGVATYLNLKAGPTIGWGFLPDDAPHEPRERDYFFLFAFWSWGAWAGLGALELGRRLAARRPARRGGGRERRWMAAGILVAALPIALNWRAVDRRREPERALAATVGDALLMSAPPRAVLFTWGDNDSYPVWYAQQARGVRPDVTVVTIPLLPAGWYRAELARRAGLLAPPSVAEWRGSAAALRALVENARARGRPIAVAASVPARTRDLLGRGWRVHGLVYVEGARSGRDDDGGTGVESQATASLARRIAPLLARGVPSPSTDPTARSMHALLRCPALALEGGSDSLASVCNRR